MAHKRLVKISYLVFFLLLVLPLASVRSAAHDVSWNDGSASQSRIRFPNYAATGSWMQLAELTDTTQAIGEEVGLSVAISGNTAVVAAPGMVPYGAALVYVKSPNGWGNMTQTATLTPSDGSPNDAFGEAVSIYANTIVV